jgi:hypothetical protein
MYFRKQPVFYCRVFDKIVRDVRAQAAQETNKTLSVVLIVRLSSRIFEYCRLLSAITSPSRHEMRPDFEWEMSIVECTDKLITLVDQMKTYRACHLN